MNVQIDVAVKRARAYWFVDGFTEMAVGGFFVLLAGILLFRGNEAQASYASWLMSVAAQISIVKIFGLLAIILILWWLKDHFTYPRTGFVRGNRVTAAQVLILIRNVILCLLLPIIGLGVASLLIASAGSVLSLMPVWFPVGLGIIWAVLCVWAGKWMGLRRFQFVGGLILLAGIFVGVWQYLMGSPVLPENMTTGIFQPPMLQLINHTLVSLSFLVLITGIILMLSGFVTFLLYRRENPTPYAEDV